MRHSPKRTDLRNAQGLMILALLFRRSCLIDNVKSIRRDAGVAAKA
jgi:hypothetical protein